MIPKYISEISKTNQFNCLSSPNKCELNFNYFTWKDFSDNFQLVIDMEHFFRFLFCELKPQLDFLFRLFVIVVQNFMMVQYILNLWSLKQYFCRTTRIVRSCSELVVCSCTRIYCIIFTFTLLLFRLFDTPGIRCLRS